MDDWTPAFNNSYDSESPIREEFDPTWPYNFKWAMNVDTNQTHVWKCLERSSGERTVVHTIAIDFASPVRRRMSALRTPPPVLSLQRALSRATTASVHTLPRLVVSLSQALSPLVIMKSPTPVTRCTKAPSPFATSTRERKKSEDDRDG